MMNAELALVLDAVKRDGSSETARRIGVGEGTVRAWVSGSSAPRERARRAIRTALTPQKTSPHAAPVGREEVLVPAADASNPEEMAVAVLRKLLKALDGVKGDGLPSLANAITRAAKLLAELTGRIELTESQILRSGAWARVRGTVWDALKPFPDAMKAVNDAIEKLDTA